MDARSRHWETNNALESHVALMRRQVQIGLDDAATRVLAAAIVSGNFDNYPDPRTGEGVPAVPFYGRWYRGAESWEAVRDVCGMRDRMCAVVSLWNFVTLNILYGDDPANLDLYSTLRGSLEQGYEDCDGLAIALATLLKAVGFENVIFRIVSVGHSGSWDHVYVLVKIGHSWVPLDPTERGFKPGTEYGRIDARRDFAV